MGRDAAFILDANGDTIGPLNPLDVSVVPAAAAVVTQANITASVVSAIIIAASARKGFSIQSHAAGGAASLWIRYGAAAVVGQGIEIPPGFIYEDPFGSQQAIHGIWSAADGSTATVSEAA